MSDFIDNAMERAYLLRQAKRPQQALGELFHILAFEPNHLEATMLVVHCYDDLDQYDQALPYAERLVQLEPEMPHAYYLLGYVHYRLDNNDKAIQHYKEALRLDPEDGNYYGSLSFVYLETGHFDTALQYAEQGLVVDPENINCLNCRTRSLSRLGQHEASQDNLKESLATHPNSEYTHLNAGITLLEQGDFVGAEKHFSETLRLQPNFTIAQEQLLLALKCQNPLYRFYHKTFKTDQSNGNRWYVISIIYAIYLVLRLVGIHNDTFILVLSLLLIVLLLFVGLAEPLSNLVITRHPKGKHLLEEHQILGSYAVLIGIALVIFNLLLTWATDSDIYWLLSLYCLSWLLLANNFYRQPLSLHTSTYRQVAVGIGLLGTTALTLAWIGHEAAILLGTIYLTLVLTFSHISRFWLKKELS